MCPAYTVCIEPSEWLLGCVAGFFEVGILCGCEWVGGWMGWDAYEMMTTNGILGLERVSKCKYL